MTHTDPGQEQIKSYSAEPELKVLGSMPGVYDVPLQGPRKTGSNTSPDTTVAVLLGGPIDKLVADDTSSQELMAVLALGKNVAVGVVKVTDGNGKRSGHLTLFGEDGSESGIHLGSFVSGENIQLGRNGLANSVKSSGLPDDAVDRIIRGLEGVSADHATVSVTGGRVRVSDHNSSNGTTIYTSYGQEMSALGRPERWNVSESNLPAPGKQESAPRPTPDDDVMSATRAIDLSTGESVPGPTLDDPSRATPERTEAQILPKFTELGRSAGHVAVTSSIEPPPTDSSPTNESVANAINPRDGKSVPESTPDNTSTADAPHQAATPAEKTHDGKPESSKPETPDRDKSETDIKEQARLNRKISMMVAQVPDKALAGAFKHAVSERRIQYTDRVDLVQKFNLVIAAFRGGFDSLPPDFAKDIHDRIEQNGFHQSSGGLWDAKPDSKTPLSKARNDAELIIKDIIEELLRTSTNKPQEPKNVRRDATGRKRRPPEERLRERPLP